jgi:plasmid replication initiation protein
MGVGHSSDRRAIEIPCRCLRSKYSIRLYEMTERRIGLLEQHEEFTIDELRALLSVPDGKLERYADFNKHCLKPAAPIPIFMTEYRA